MSKRFVSIDATSTKSSLSLFDEKTLLGEVGSDDVRASSHLIVYLSSLLNQHRLTLSDLSFIAINKGPGAFTSLRVAIATVNGIAFGCHKPLIGIDGLDALCMHMAVGLSPDQVSAKSLFVALLNAYNNDVYYAVEDFEAQLQGALPKFKVHEKGCKKIEMVIPLLVQLGAKHQLFIAGNAVPLHRSLLDASLADNSITYIDVATAPAEIIGRMAFEQFQRNEGLVDQIEPLYLKSQYFAVRNPPLKPNTSQ